MPLEGASHLGDHIFHSLEPRFGIIPLSFALFQLHTLCVAQLLLVSQILCLRFALLNLHTFACFCTINHTQSYKGRLLSQWLSKVAVTGAPTG